MRGLQCPEDQGALLSRKPARDRERPIVFPVPVDVAIVLRTLRIRTRDPPVAGEHPSAERGGMARELDQLFLGVRIRDARQRPHLRVAQLAAVEEVSCLGQLAQRPGNADVLPRGPRGQAAAPGNPVGTVESPRPPPPAGALFPPHLQSFPPPTRDFNRGGLDLGLEAFDGEVGEVLGLGTYVRMMNSPDGKLRAGDALPVAQEATAGREAGRPAAGPTRSRRSRRPCCRRGRAASAISRMTSSVRSVSTPDARFGQAIQRPAVGHQRALQTFEAPLQLGPAAGEEDDHVERPGGARLDRHTVRQGPERVGEAVRRPGEGDGVLLLDPELARQRSSRVAGHLDWRS